MFNTDINRPTEEILEDVRQAAVMAFNNKSASFVAPPFAALLVKLSREADETARIVRDKTNRLYWLTIFILALTFLMFLLNVGMFATSAFDFYEKHHSQSQVGTGAKL